MAVIHTFLDDRHLELSLLELCSSEPSQFTSLKAGRDAFICDVDDLCLESLLDSCPVKPTTFNSPLELLLPRGKADELDLVVLHLHVQHGSEVPCELSSIAFQERRPKAVSGTCQSTRSGQHPQPWMNISTYD